MNELPQAMAAIFSAPGAAVMGAMTEAMAKARSDGCDCEVCSILRAAQQALEGIVEDKR